MDKKDKKIRVKVVEEDANDEGVRFDNDASSNEEVASIDKVISDKDKKEANEVTEEVISDDAPSQTEKKVDKKSDEESTDKRESEPVTLNDSPDRIPFWILFFAFIIGLTLGAGLIGGIFYYKTKVEKISDVVTDQTPAPLIEGQETPVAAPTSSPISIEKSKFKLQVQNGSGIAGEAGKNKDLLENNGFVSVSSGNASNYLNEETEISYKEDIPKELLDEIKVILKEYKTEDGEILKSSETYDVIIVLGTLKN